MTTTDIQHYENQRNLGSYRSTEWMSLGNCRLVEPDIFFPSDGAGVDKARKICSTCPVRDHWNTHYRNKLNTGCGAA
jgi:hypothetical protein